jgi:MscS family membrane protein
MFRILTFVLLGSILGAQTPAPETQDAKDPLGRGSPQSSIFQFLEACHAHDYAKASRYLDLRGMPSDQRLKSGPDVAHQLEDLLDDTPFDIAALSRDAEGDQSDGLGSDFEHLDTFRVDGRTLDLQLERIALRPDLHVWLVSSDSVAMIPEAHKLVAETPFEHKLPQMLVTFEILDTPVWRWIALIAMAVISWFAARVASWAVTAALRPLTQQADVFRAPLSACLGLAAMRGALELAPPASIARLFIERALGLAFALGIAWLCGAVVDLIMGRWHARLDQRARAMSYSVLPLGRQILKLALYLIAVLSVLSAWGYNTSTILAGVGVGGLAVALAAQKTIENLFGGISVIGDRPVLVGDECRFGDRTGVVMHIGLRSTRIRTRDRTVISVPNGQFSSMALENISGRDKTWFHPTLNLRLDTTSEQMEQVLTSVREILANSPKVEVGPIPVRFVGVGAYSLNVEVAVYIKTSDEDEFLAIQQDLLLRMLQAIEKAGTSLAVPLQETFEARRT